MWLRDVGEKMSLLKEKGVEGESLTILRMEDMAWWLHGRG